MSLIAMPRRTDPSWKAGFAHSASESANPGLWKGLVGMWVPGLGPTGSTLRDVSGRENHGTQNNMDSSNWFVTEKGWVLDYDGTSSPGEFIQATISVNTAQITVVVLLKYQDARDVSGHAVDLSGSGFGSGTPRLLGRTDNNNWFVRDDAGDNNSSLLFGREDGVWTHNAVTIEGTSGISYKNGSQLDSATLTGYDPTQLSFLQIGRGAGGNRFGGQIGPLAIYNRVLSPNEIQQLFQDPDAQLRLRRRVFSAAVAVGGILVHPGMDGLHADLSGGMRG